MPRRGWYHSRLAPPWLLRAGVAAAGLLLAAGMPLHALGSWSPTTENDNATVVSGGLRPPTGLTATPNAPGTTVNLAWTLPAAAYQGSSQVIEVSSAGGPMTVLATVGPTVTTYAHTPTVKNRQYCYTVSTTWNNWSVTGLLQCSRTAPLLAINAGGAASGTYAADNSFAGGSTYSTAAAIDTSQVGPAVAPQAVYQTERYGNFTYTITGQPANTSRHVRLHFAEIYWTTPGSRIFNVDIQGTPVLTNFDIVATAGGPNIALAYTYPVTTDASGNITITFTTVVDNAKVSGIELLP